MKTTQLFLVCALAILASTPTAGRSTRQKRRHQRQPRKERSKQRQRERIQQGSPTPSPTPMPTPMPTEEPSTAPVLVPEPVFVPPISAPPAPMPTPTPTPTPTLTPTPTPTPMPTEELSTAPVSVPEPVFVPPISPPPVTVGSQQRWGAFAQFVPDWEDFKAKRGNGVCDRLEECRTDPACCDTSSPPVCGNGFCEEGETRLGCTEDCTHHNSVCGNGECEQGDDSLGWYHTNMYENEYGCPVDCSDSPNLDVSSPVTGSCFMRDDGTCDNLCGDGICTGDDTCETCPRDCGECPLATGDGICSYPFEAAGTGDCDGSSITNFITYKGEDYATIDNSEVFDGVYEDSSCSTTPQTVPAGWRLADWDASIAYDLVVKEGAIFDTYCLVFEGGNAASTYDGLQGDSGCGIIPIQRYNGDRYAISKGSCASRLMIQRIKASGSKTCPGCGNGGMCNTLTGKCACNGMWTGPACERAIGDYSVPAAASDWYEPALGTTWEWQIDWAPIPGGNGPGSLHDVELYDIDYMYPAAVVADLQSKGKKVMCYVSAGTSEDFRPDINLFPEEVKGGLVSFGDGDVFEDEQWLDLRRLDLVAPIMLERLDIMKAKGCDAVEWDNADLPVHELGFENYGQVSLSVQIAYNAWIAAQTHARGMGVAMKNNNEAAAFHVDDYDMVVNEECWINGNCNNYWPWIKAGKPILNTEYFTARCMYCEQANLMNISTIKKVPDLTSCRVDCKSGFNSIQCSAASVGGVVSYPIDWTVGAGAVMNEDWCPMTVNTATDECPSDRFRECDPSVGY